MRPSWDTRKKVGSLEGSSHDAINLALQIEVVTGGERRTVSNSFFSWLGFNDRMDWRKARPLGVLIGLMITALFLLALFSAFFLLVQFLVADQGSSSTGRLGAGALIVAILSAPFLIWRTITSHQTLRFQREGHITDRISKAVEQLGADKTIKVSSSTIEGGFLTREETEPNIEVRVGGILSLERIAQDSVEYDNGRDHVRIMEILCSYIRQNSKLQSARSFPLPDWKNLNENSSQAEQKEFEDWMSVRFGGQFLPIPEPNAREWSRTLPPLREDISLALLVIGRRNSEQMDAEARWGRYAAEDASQPRPAPEAPGNLQDDQEAVTYVERLKAWAAENRSYRGYRLDLRNCNLQGAKLAGLNFQRADFSGSALDGADFHMTRLEGARFASCKMRGVSLISAHLEDSSFEHANLEAAYLTSAHLSMCYCNWAKMDGASLHHILLHLTLMQGTSLNRAELFLAQFYGTSLLNADLYAAKLNRARFRNADFGGAVLVNCSFLVAEIDQKTVFGSATLNGASFLKTRLENESLTSEMIASCFGDATVHLSNALVRPKHWPTWPLKKRFHDDWESWRTNPMDFTPTEEAECVEADETVADENAPIMRTVFRATLP